MDRGYQYTPGLPASAKRTKLQTLLWTRYKFYCTDAGARRIGRKTKDDLLLDSVHHAPTGTDLYCINSLGLQARACSDIIRLFLHCSQATNSLVHRGAHANDEHFQSYALVVGEYAYFQDYSYCDP